jgi:hypothetical protein
MALISPGVEVNITTEAFSDSAGPGTIPLIVLATASNKLTPSASGIAPFTTAAYAGKLFPATSQRELLANLGNPFFWSNQGSQLHGYELNEYGLHAAWNVLGAQDRCYVLRAPIDLSALVPTRTAPSAPAHNGTFWFDYAGSKMGVFVSNGNATPGLAWTKVSPLLPTDADLETTNVPKAAYGANGAFAIVTQTSDNFLYEKNAGAWTKVGSAAWKTAHPTKVSSIANPPAVTGSFSINGTTIAALTNANAAAVATAITTAAIAGISAAVVSNAVVITNTTGGNVTLANVSGTPLATLGLNAGTTKSHSLTFTNNASFPAGSVAGDVWIKMTTPADGTQFVLKRYNGNTAAWNAVSIVSYPFDSTLLDGNAAKDSAATSYFSPVVNNTIYLGYDAATGSRQLRIWNVATGWNALSYEASLTAPVNDAVEGTLWYSPDFTADIMVGDGLNWRGYKNVFINTDSKGVIVSGSAPQVQSDGTALAAGDVWLDSSDLENYPALYRYDETSGRWGQIDKTDQTTPFGILFADARADSGTAFAGQTVTGYSYGSTDAEALAMSDFVDPDAPDARAYPAGTLLFNTRASTYNVKEWRPAHFRDGGFDANTNYAVSTYRVGSSAYTFPALADTGRWVTVSGNKLDGSPYMGRRAQRAMVVRSLQEVLANNEEIRSEMHNFSLIVAPGYPELLDEMASLNADQSETATILLDLPARLSPRQVEAWALNAANAGENGEDGLVTGYEYAAAYYPWGLSTNVDGANVMVPASTIALRTVLYNDRVAHPWNAPAGDERGMVTNATSVGYLSAEDEYVPLMLNRGQRDLIYSNKVNPIVALPGLGLRVMGQKTLSPQAGPLDRVQGARLANYLRYHLANLTRPFIMAQNDAQTRGTAEITVQRFFNGLVTLRAISDYAVLVDETNNTKERQARHELWIDCAIQPIYAIEFIYIPCRFRNDDVSI